MCRKRCIMMVPMTLAFIFISLLLSQSGEAFKCGNSVLSVGDSSSRILQVCGSPMKKEKTTVKDPDSASKRAGRILDKRAANQARYRDKSKIIDKWYYNCGKNDYIRIVTFENGTFRKEETGGRGKGESQCKGKK